MKILHPSKLVLFILLSLFFLGNLAFAQNDFDMPIGMNLPSLSYFSTGLVFSDVMTTASSMMSFSQQAKDWNSRLINRIPVDSQGWPLELPYVVDGDPQGCRFLISSYYKGDYVVLFDGDGDLQWGGVKSEVRNGVTHLIFSGKRKNVWVSILRSAKGNHIRNMRIIPARYMDHENSMPLFNSLYLKGLQPFHVLRFMDLTSTNNSMHRNWSDRTKPDFFSQGTKNGMSWEYAIELANTLHQDPWICVPHQATDEYITQLALLFHDKLSPDLTLYVEYSNEIWNWMFKQSNYVAQNAPGAEKHVVSGLRAVGERYCGAPDKACHPEKDAWMMARTFRIFAKVWQKERQRLVTVAAVQHGWPDNTGRILKFLFTDKEGFKVDALSPGGYFGFRKGDHTKWADMHPSKVTPEMVIAAAEDSMTRRENRLTRETAMYAKKYGLDYLVYEGGQHMQPYQQKDWGYNQAVYDAQVAPGMYDLYMKNFAELKKAGCKLFMAFSYVGPREVKWGSWGHLEKLDDLYSPNLKTIAPKYQALLDVNTPKQPR